MRIKIIIAKKARIGSIKHYSED